MDATLPSLDLTQAAPVQAPPPTKDVARAKQAGESFEAVFISQFIGSMFDGIKADSMFGGGEGEDMFRSLLTDEYGKQIAAQGGFGLASAIQAQLLKTESRQAMGQTMAQTAGPAP